MSRQIKQLQLLRFVLLLAVQFNTFKKFHNCIINCGNFRSLRIPLKRKQLTEPDSEKRQNMIIIITKKLKHNLQSRNVITESVVGKLETNWTRIGVIAITRRYSRETFPKTLEQYLIS